MEAATTRMKLHGQQSKNVEENSKTLRAELLETALR